MYQLPREFGSFNGLAGLCISVDCVSVWVFCRESVYWWLWVFQLSGWHTCIYFWIKGLLIMYTWHLNQQLPRILTLHLHNKMRLNVNLHFNNPVHVVNTLSYVLAFFSGIIPSPPPHKAIISLSYIKHTGFTKNVSMQNLDKYVFPDY